MEQPQPAAESGPGLGRGSSKSMAATQKVVAFLEASTPQPRMWSCVSQNWLCLGAL
jgi:hypothetical protein